MDEKSYASFLQADLPRYAADNVRAGFWTQAESLARARETYDRFLPEGVRTPGQHLFLIHSLETGRDVGMLWIGAQPGSVKGSGFVYNLYIEPPFRRQGFARAAMLAAEAEARNRGWSSLSLHVFGFNHPAIELYTSLGYQPRSLNMIKALDPATTREGSR